jgi:hypothetical protein
MGSESSHRRWHLLLVSSNRRCRLGHTCPPPRRVGLEYIRPPPPPRVGLRRTCPPPRVGLRRTRPPPRLGWWAEWAIVVVEVEWSLCLLDVVVVVVAMLTTPRCRRGGGGVVAALRCRH